MILVVALIIFGPKKLPQLARSFGKSMAEFKRASEDFKQQWEKEVDSFETAKESIKSELSLVEAEDKYNEKSVSRQSSFGELAGETQTASSYPYEALEPAATKIATPEIKEVEPAIKDEPPQPQKTSKRDWL